MKGPFDVLDPADRVGEVVFGLIMTLTFTLGSGLTAEAGHEGVRQLLIAALSCNVAWGVIDGVFCWVGRVAERGRLHRLRAELRATGDRAAALARVREELADTLAPFAPADARERLYEAAVDGLGAAAGEPPGTRREDLAAAAASFALVFGATLPAVVPFLIFQDKFTSLRASNAVLIAMLFATGWRWARWTGGSPLATGAGLAAIGIALVAVAIPLGG